MKNPKSIRLNDSLITVIEKLAILNNQKFNSQITTMLNEYCETNCKEVKQIGGENYYPIHLTNEELILIANELITYNSSHNCIIQIRKDCGGKGVDFKMDVYSKNKTIYTFKKRYSFSLNANWQIENVFEHWIEKTSDKKAENFCCKKFAFKILTINNIINENYNQKNTPELNLIFKEDKWKILFEQKYPLLAF